MLITNKVPNTLIHLSVLRQIDMIMANGWYSLEDKGTWILLHFVNHIFDLHDIFHGSYLAERAIVWSKKILFIIIDIHGATLN